MSTTTAPPDFCPWTEESADRPDRARIRARIGGLHCSLCTGTIEKALGRQPGVDKVAVSLTHEQALVEYDPRVARPDVLLQILRDIGYTVSDPRKLRAFEEEERDLVREGRRFLTATAFSLLAVVLIANMVGPAAIVLQVTVFASLLGLIYLVLRARSLGAAIGGTVVAGVSRPLADGDPLVIGHPSGVVPVWGQARPADGTWIVERAAYARTARRVAEGHTYVRRSAWAAGA